MAKNLNHFLPSGPLKWGQRDELNAAAARHFTKLFESVGVTPPPPTAGVKALELIQSHQHTALVEKLGREAHTVKDADAAKWYAAAVKQITESRARQDLRDAAERNTPIITADQRAAQAVELLAEPFAAAVEELQAASADLPEEGALDPDVVFKTHRTREYEAATRALEKLSAFGSIWPLPAAGDVPPNISRVLSVVSVPEVDSAKYANNRDSSLFNPSPLRDRVRAFYDSADADPDQALVEVAKGMHPDVEFALLTSSQEGIERAVRARQTRTSLILQGKDLVEARNEYVDERRARLNERAQERVEREDLKAKEQRVARPTANGGPAQPVKASGSIEPPAPIEWL